MDGERVVYEVTEPAVLFDKEHFVMHKLGNRENVMVYFDQCIEKCKKANSTMYEEWMVMDLPKDADVMDRILNNTGYLERFIKENNIAL